MSLTADELVEKTRDQRKRGRFEEALVSAITATNMDPDNADAWWLLALTRLNLNNSKSAIIALRKTVKLAPWFDTGWSCLGEELLKSEYIDESKNAFQKAIDLNSENIDALQGLFKIYKKENDHDNDDKIIHILEKIEKISQLSSTQLNYLGIIHHRYGRPHEAIKYWRIDAFKSNSSASSFNLGLAYNHKEISQDADAIDMWRLTIRKWPNYEPPHKSIKKLLPRMLDLANNARNQGNTLLPRDQWYDNYINPFELLNGDDNLGFNDFDPKTIQRLKKRILHEIDLEDGVISWLTDVTVDKSRAIGVCEELSNDQTRWFHWLVYKNKPLLNFLSKGEHEHFLVTEIDCHLDTLEVVEDQESGFREWMGEFFAPQFDRVLSKAIDTRNIVILECLLDGRRWIHESYIDSCFANSRRSVDKLLNQLRNTEEQANVNKPSVQSINKTLNDNFFIKIMNLLPSYFEDFQNESIEIIRNIAIKSYNLHDDIDLSKNIINLTKLFEFRSALANNAIEKDLKEIQNLIKKERKYEVKLTSGSQQWHITKEGVAKGDSEFIASLDVSSVRWGAMITGQEFSPTYDFLFATGSDDGRSIIFQWKSSEDNEQHLKYFNDLITAAYSYLFPTLVDKATRRLEEGYPLKIGPCWIYKHGIEFETKGWFSTKIHKIPWDASHVVVENGNMTVCNIFNSNAKISFSHRETNNAPLLRILANMKNGRDD